MTKTKKPLHEPLVYERLAEVSSAFSHPIRLQILDLLEEKNHNCTEILDVINIPKPNLSQHLNVLKRAQLVDSKKSGLYQIYFINNPEIWRSFKVLKQTLLDHANENNNQQKNNEEAKS